MGPQRPHEAAVRPESQLQTLRTALRSVPRLQTGSATGSRSIRGSHLWQYAKNNDFVLVTQDSDFADMAAHYGHPPKVIWLRCANQPVAAVEALRRRHAKNIAEFDQNITAACLEFF